MNNKTNYRNNVTVLDVMNNLPNGNDSSNSRPRVKGKFIYIGDEIFHIKGVTYGTFEANSEGDLFPSTTIVNDDFKRMVATGINCVRVYTVPPKWLLDLANTHKLYVMVGIPWEQHLAILESKSVVESIHERFLSSIESCVGHPAILCYSIGNEIPANVVRWHGRRKMERFLESLFNTVKSVDPEALVTYVNFPTTEYLDLSFVDFFSFNVYLETEDKLRAYLSRIQILANDKPLVLAEVGLDSYRNGEAAQGRSLEWQVKAIFETGCAGVFVFAWTDEWFLDGRLIDDWHFGLTKIDREEKYALASIERAFTQYPFNENLSWPSFSVVVCSYNGSKTIEKTLQSLVRLDYPNFEIIVVDDGSKDNTANIAKQFPVQLICTPNRGLSSARNTGYRAGSGEIVAYIDDDAYPDQYWLYYLALAYLQQPVAGVGGPNYPVPEASLIADCVANSPGGPMEVLLSDDIAEHVPGCNMSFRREALDAIDGFDEQFRAAGDDVDLCWRIQEQVGPIGFQPAAYNWHHRRDSIKGYWKQQHGYGIAEALLEKKWPDKYNAAGHITWAGRIYGQGLTRHLGSLQHRIYQGVWGSSPFQRIYTNNTTSIGALPLMPEWLLVIAVLVLLSASGVLWTPMALFLIPLAIAVSISISHAVLSAIKGSYQIKPSASINYLKRVAITSVLHLTQPVVRLYGRLRQGLTPWRSNTESLTVTPRFPRTISGSLWDGKNMSVLDRLTRIQHHLKQSGVNARVGNEYDNWEIEVAGGIQGSARLSLMVEAHGADNEQILYRATQRSPYLQKIVLGILFLCMYGAISSGAVFVFVMILSLCSAIVIKSLLDSANAIQLLEIALQKNVDESIQTTITPIEGIEESIEEPLRDAA